MTPALLSDDTVAFVEREVAIDLASRSAELRPSACRGFACRVAPDRQSVTVYVRRQEAQQLLQDLLVCDAIAVVVCLPEAEAALQIKGRQVKLSAASADEVAFVQRYRQRFVDGIAALGYDRDFGEAYMTIDPEQMVAVSFTPEAVFQQTPGPQAGQRVGGGRP